VSHVAAAVSHVAASSDDLHRHFHHGDTEITEHHREDIFFYINKYKDLAP
jgi:hypothetical protein